TEKISMDANGLCCPACFLNTTLERLARITEQNNMTMPSPWSTDMQSLSWKIMTIPANENRTPMMVFSVTRSSPTIVTMRAVSRGVVVDMMAANAPDTDRSAL